MGRGSWAREGWGGGLGREGERNDLGGGGGRGSSLTDLTLFNVHGSI